MKKLFVSVLLVVLAFNLVIIPAISNPISDSENIDLSFNESSFRAYYFLKFDLMGKGKVDPLSPAVFWKISEGETSTFAVISTERNQNGVVRRDFFKSYTISGPTTGVLMFFRGTVDYNPETEIVEINGSAIMGLSIP